MMIQTSFLEASLDVKLFKINFRLSDNLKVCTYGVKLKTSIIDRFVDDERP